MNLPILKNIFYLHVDVLRELRLRNIHLQGKGAWKDVALEMGKVLTLNLIQLSYLHQDDVGLGDDDCLTPIALAFMQRFAGQNIGIVENSKFVMAGHRPNYMPTEAFKQLCAITEPWVP